jgi:RimJ/RimL family protein N-acetyltransferase
MQFEGFHIRQLTDADAENYFSLVDRNRKRLEDFFAGTVARNKTIQDTRIFISDITEKAAKKIYFPFVIIDAAQNLVGYVDVKSIDWNIPKAELGFFIDAGYEGKGIISRAVAKIVEHCFETLKMKKLFLRTHEKNTGSRRVAEKNGFILEGIIKSDYKTTSGVIVDLMYYGLLESEYAARSALLNA